MFNPIRSIDRKVKHNKALREQERREHEEWLATLSPEQRSIEELRDEVRSLRAELGHVSTMQTLSLCRSGR